MQNFEILQKKFGLEPVTKQVVDLRPGDVIPVFDRKYLKPQEVFGTPQRRGSVVDVNVRQIKAMHLRGKGRYGASQEVPVFEQQDVNALYETMVLDVLRPGVPSLPLKQIYMFLREHVGVAVGQQRVKMAIDRLVQQGVLFETQTVRASKMEQSGYRQYLTACPTPQVVYERRNHRVGWVVRFEERPPVKMLYPVVQWFDGSIQVSHEKFLEPVNDERAIRGVRMAIQYRRGDFPDGFIEVPTNLIKAARSLAHYTNRTTVAMIGDFLQKEGVQLPKMANPIDRVILWLDKYYPGWSYGIAPQDLIAEPPAGAI